MPMPVTSQLEERPGTWVAGAAPLEFLHFSWGPAPFLEPEKYRMYLG